MRLLLFLLFAVNLFAFETFDQIQILNKNIHVKKSGYIVTKENLTPKQAITYFKENKTLELPKKVYMLNNDYTAVTWLFYQIQTDTNDSIYLDVIDPYADYCTMHTFKDDNLQSIQVSGNAVELDKRTIEQMPVRFKLQNGNMIYAIQVKAHISTFGGISLGDENKLNKHWYMLYIFAIFVFGVFVSLFAYNLFLFVSTKDTLYLYYLLYTVGFYGIVTITIGILPFILGQFDNFYLLIFTGPSIKFLEIIGLSLFALKFLELTTFNKKILYTYLIILFSILILYLSGFPILANIMFPLVSGFSLIILYLGITSYKRGYEPAKYFIAAMGVASVLTAVTFLAQVGLVPMGFFNNNISSIALMWDMPMLSFALAYRMKLLEEKNKLLEKEQKANAKFIITGELIGSIAHQWRQPLSELSSILMKTKAKVNYDKISTEELNSFLDEQDKVLKRMSNIIETFNQTSSKNIKKLFDYKDAIQKTLKHFDNEISDLGIQIEIDCIKNAQINGYENIFVEVLLIIFNNAIYTLNKNNIQNPKIKIKSSYSSPYLIIEIQDNGGGIQIKPIETIFDPYVSTKNDNGLGLGLYIAQKNMKEYFNGKIEVQNTNDGAKFEIMIEESHDHR